MKKIILFLGLSLFATGGAKVVNTEAVQQTKTKCKYNGKTLYRGKKGGCFYFNSSDKKTYVDRSYCNC